ncbi:MAG: hypothetical protein IJP86_12550 [Synergistaceae bacterium]|nr:hypothetical protein [Synergistaceae bacterium]
MTHHTTGYNSSNDGHFHVGHLIHYTARQIFDDWDGVRYVWHGRGKHRNLASLAIADWDIIYRRGRRSTGWKSHKHRRQWEHKLFMSRRKILNPAN